MSDPAAAHGTTLPSMLVRRGGPPHALYPDLLMELVMPQMSSEYPGNSFFTSMQNARCALVDFPGEPRNLGLFTEALRRGERAGEQPRAVADRNLALRTIELTALGQRQRRRIEARAGALPALHVQPVIEPAVLLRRVIGV